MSGIGEYVHLVELSKASATPDDPEGGYTQEYVPLDPAVWYCQITAATAQDLERVSGGLTTQQATHLIRGRYHPQLTADCRVSFRGRVFEIRSVQDRDQQRTDLDVLAVEVLDDLAAGHLPAGPAAAVAGASD
jgi:SPP1 family predicted phage head-tail adaptor